MTIFSGLSKQIEWDLAAKGVENKYDKVFMHNNKGFLLPSNQELFISRITKTISKTSKLSRRKKRGWFTKEAMSKTLQWSSILGRTCPAKFTFINMFPHVIFLQVYTIIMGFNVVPILLDLNTPASPLWTCHLRSYIKSAVDYCERSGNERLVKTLASSN